jgi:hypothetical protein
VTAHVRVCALAYYDERTPEPWLTTNRVAYAVSTHPFPTLDMGPEHRADVARKLVDQAVEELQDWMQANTTFGPPDPRHRHRDHRARLVGAQLLPARAIR